MPLPTMLILAMSLSTSTCPPPKDSAMPRSISSAFLASTSFTVKVKSVVLSAPMFCTITSTSIPESLIGLNILAATPGMSGTRLMVILASSSILLIPETIGLSMLSFSSSTKVPFPSLKLDRTLIGILYLLAYSTARN